MHSLNSAIKTLFGHCSVCVCVFVVTEKQLSYYDTYMVRLSLDMAQAYSKKYAFFERYFLVKSLFRNFLCSFYLDI